MTILQIASSNLRQRKMKSFMVMLGIAIGIATMVSVYSVIATMKTDMKSQMADYGANILITADTGEITYSYGGISVEGVLFDKHLTNEDVTAIDSLGSRQMIRAVVPKLLGVVTVAGNELVIAGTDIRNEFSIKPWLRIVDLLAKADADKAGGDSGSSMGGEKLDLSREDYSKIELKDNEVMLGAAAAYTLALFPSNRFAINGYEFIVKEILEKNGTPEDEQILMNLKAAQEVLNLTDEITTIEIAADYTKGSEEDLINEIGAAMPHAKVASLSKAMRDRNEVTSRLTYFGYSVSFIILISGMLVAGLGMTSSVRERTREIGIFRAIGFRKSHIRNIIFLEGVILSLSGGLTGFILGTAIARFLVPMITESVPEIPLNLSYLAVSIVISLVTGAIASIYPAQQAARLDPAESIRFI